ncbi:hypothetical protein GQ42DRAFT_91580, partial [Ramicandelaber brevisporus]
MEDIRAALAETRRKIHNKTKTLEGARSLRQVHVSPELQRQCDEEIARLTSELEYLNLENRRLLERSRGHSSPESPHSAGGNGGAGGAGGGNGEYTSGYDGAGSAAFGHQQQPPQNLAMYRVGAQLNPQLISMRLQDIKYKMSIEHNLREATKKIIAARGLASGSLGAQPQKSGRWGGWLSSGRSNSTGSSGGLDSAGRGSTADYYATNPEKSIQESD